MPSHLPVLHPNGTSAESLAAGYEAARDKVRIAIRALAEATDAFQAIEFNLRDYYPDGQEAFDAARAKRVEARGNLDSVEGYLVEHVTFLRGAVRQVNAGT